MSKSWTDEECFKYGHILKDKGIISYEEFLIEIYKNGHLSKKELEEYKQSPLWDKKMEK